MRQPPHCGNTRNFFLDARAQQSNVSLARVNDIRPALYRGDVVAMRRALENGLSPDDASQVAEWPLLFAAAQVSFRFVRVFMCLFTYLHTCMLSLVWSRRVSKAIVGEGRQSGLAQLQSCDTSGRRHSGNEIGLFCFEICLSVNITQNIYLLVIFFCF